MAIPAFAFWAAVTWASSVLGALAVVTM